MAKQPDECMFCGIAHKGVCGTPVEKAKAPPKKRAVKFSDNPELDKPIETVPLLDPVRAAMKAAAASVEESNVEQFSSAKRGNYLETVQTESSRDFEDHDFGTAIKVLLDAEMLHPEEVERYDFLRGPREEVRQLDVSVWKSRHEAATAKVGR